MAIKLNSYISFDGNAKEAGEFYQSIFGGALEVSTFADFASSEMPVTDKDKDKIMHAYLKGENDIELMLSDTPEGMPYESGTRITLALNGDDEDILRGYWDKLAEGGQITAPLEKSFWNSTFGMLTDKFGVNWMVDIGNLQG